MPISQTCSAKPLIHLVGDDSEQNLRLSSTLKDNGYNVSLFSSTDELAHVCNHNNDDAQRPAAVVIDALLAEENSPELPVLGDLMLCKDNGIPVVVVCNHDSLQARISAFRAGASRYLLKPVNDEQLVQLLDELTHHQPANPYRVMVVHDASTPVPPCARLLHESCFAVKLLDQPLQTLQSIKAFNPDVVMLDVNGTEVSGAELAAILHQSQPQLPVVLVTDQQDIGSQLKSLNLDSIDLLQHPLECSFLISKITSRARQARNINNTRQHLQSLLYNREREHQALDQHAIVSIADAAGRITYVNDKFCEISGYSRDELLGANHRIVKSGEHPPEFYQNLWDTISRGQLWQGNLCNRRRDGSYYWVASTITPFMDANGKPYQYVSIRTDITATKQVEKELKLSRERLRRGQIFANIGTWDWNIKTGDLVWSERIAPLFGYADGELETSYDNFLNAVHPDDQALVVAAVNDCLVNDTPYDIEHRVVWPDGTVRWLQERGAVLRDEQGEALQMLGVVQDIDERKRTEQALADSEQCLREAQTLSHIGNWQADLVTGALYWSDEIYRIFGHQPGDFEPSVDLFKQAVHPDDLHLIEDDIIVAQQTGIHDVVHRIVLPDGSIRYVHELAEATLDDNGELVKLTGTVQDITELSLIQERAEQQRRLLDMLHHATTDFVEKANFNATISRMLDTLLRLTGSDYGFIGEVLYDENQQPYIRTHAITNIAWDNESQKLYESLEENGFEFRHLDNLFGQVVTSKSVVISNSPATDPRSKGLPNGHPPLHAFLGVPIFYAGELVGIYCIANRQQGYDLDLRNFLLPFDTTYSVMIHSRRITEAELRNRDDLIEAKEIAERASQAKSDFLSSMSHELRTPMNAILGFGQLLEYDTTLSAHHQDNISEILKAGHHLLDLINDILDLAKIEAGKIELNISTVDVCSIIDECTTLMAPLAARRNISIDHSGLQHSFVMADRTRLKQMLMNLLSNAIKYNKDNGHVEIEITRPSRDTLRLSVIDTGIGISDEDMQQLFTPFTRFNIKHSTVEGTGIGLTITRSIVEMMHGHIGAESTLGDGSCFWIELPLESVAEQTTDKRPQQTRSTSQTRTSSATAMDHYKILYIEDNPSNMRLVEQLIGIRNDIELYTAHSPRLGIDLAEVHQPDLILLDINMPGMDGYQVLEILKNTDALENTPVIAVTANAMPRDIEHGKAAGFSDYVTKPLQVNNFLNLIDKYLSSNRAEKR